jgi:hypothetical protein
MKSEFLPEAEKEFREAARYSVEGDLVLVVAVAHQKRRPTYWRRRLRSRHV